MNRHKVRLLGVFLAVVGVLLTLLTVAPSNQAWPMNGGQVQQASNMDGGHLKPIAAERALWGPFTNYRVGSENLCVDQSQAAYTAGMPVELSSDRWDYTELFIAHASDYDLNACSHLYNDGQRLSVEIVNSANGSCIHFYHTYLNGKRWRTIMYANVYYPSCWATQYEKESRIAAAMGWWLGMAYNDRSDSVMNLDRVCCTRGPSLQWDIPSINSIYNF